MSGPAARIAGAALAVLAGVALVVAAVVLMTRGDDAAPMRIIAPQATIEPEPATREIRVQVGGAVMSPGVYTMQEGDRVMDAITAAGGARADADLSAINMARRVQDEALYLVPTKGGTSPTTSASPTSVVARPAGGKSAGLVDLNAASALELQELPGIGPVLAERIVSHREVNGLFDSVDDVQDVAGIGPKTMDSESIMVFRIFVF